MFLLENKSTRAGTPPAMRMARIGMMMSLLFVGTHIKAQPPESLAYTPQLPPPAEEVEIQSGAEEVTRFRPLAEGLRWETGDMTDEEQLYVELINRARANPEEEGRWLVSLTDADIVRNLGFFNVNLDQVLNDPLHGFLRLAAAPPLAPNAMLNAGARAHVDDMFVNTFQAHQGTDGSRAGDRIKSEGYNWRATGENVFSNVDSVIHGHAGFQIDWGLGPGGIQSPPGHRLTIHNSEYREIGVGVIIGSRENAFPNDPDSIYRDVGPQLAAQVLAAPLSDSIFITGVAYYDFNSNQFYDMGEGLGGLTVDVSGNAFHAVTMNSGGYSVPVSANGDFDVHFSSNEFPSQNSSVTISNSENVKLDYLLEYQPRVSGPAVVGVNQAVSFELPSLHLAERYQLERSRSGEFTGIEGGASGLDEFSYSGAGSYAVIQTRLFDDGGQAFRLAHAPPISAESLEWNRRFVVGNQGSLSFRSRLGSAFDGEVATFQVSDDEGQSWQTLWTQNGTSSNANPLPFPAPSESSFSTRTVDLSNFEGKTIRVRWEFRFTGGRVWVGNDQTIGTGWYFDTITTQGLNSLESELLPEQNQPGFQIVSGAQGTFSLRGRAFIKGEWRPWGETTDVLVSNDAPSAFQVISVTRVEDSMLVKVDVGEGGTAPVIQSADTLQGPWLRAESILIEESGQANVFDVTISIGGLPSRFYRILQE